MKWTFVWLPGPVNLNYLLFVECEHCFTKVRKCFHSECNFFLCYLIWNIMGHLREKIEHVEILKFYVILDMQKKISCWYLFWISKFKFWWDLLILIKCPETFSCFKYLINPPNIDNYSLGKNYSVVKKYKNEKVIQFIFHKIEYSFGVNIEDIWGEIQP